MTSTYRTGAYFDSNASDDLADALKEAAERAYRHKEKAERHGKHYGFGTADFKAPPMKTVNPEFMPMGPPPEPQVSIQYFEDDMTTRVRMPSGMYLCGPDGRPVNLMDRHEFQRTGKTEFATVEEALEKFARVHAAFKRFFG